MVGQSSIVDKQFLKLQQAIGKEIDYQEELLEVLGMMDTLFATFTKKRDTRLEENKNNGVTEIIGTNRKYWHPSQQIVTIVNLRDMTYSPGKFL